MERHREGVESMEESGRALSAQQLDELEALNRRYQSLWWPFVASNVLIAVSHADQVAVDPAEDRWSAILSWLFDLILTGNLLPAHEAGLVANLLHVAIRFSFLWLLLRFLRVARPWPFFERQSLWIAVPLALFAPLVVMLGTAFRMRALARRLQLRGGVTGGFFGLDVGQLRRLKSELAPPCSANWQLSEAPSNPNHRAEGPQAAGSVPHGAAEHPVQEGHRQQTWLDRLDEHCRRIGTPTRWHHFHPEALAYGVLCGMPPEDFLKRGYNKRIADLPEASRGFGKALADQLERRIRTEFGLKRPD
jgi:hypothetical protein